MGDDSFARRRAAARRWPGGILAAVRPLLRGVAWLGPASRRRPPFSVALVTLVVVVTALTGAAIGGLAWRENRAMSRALVETSMAQTGRLVAAQAVRFLTEAESAARLGPELVAAGQLDADSAVALERFTLGVLRAHPHLTWVSYGSSTDAFVGAWRNRAGTLHVNRSFPWEGRIRLEEDAIADDGVRRPVRRSADHGYRPTTRPYFRLAAARRDVVWTEPYEFYAGGGAGITCAAPLLSASRDLRGVFTVDFSLDRLASFVETIDVSRRGRVLIATPRGDVLIGRRPGDAGLIEATGGRLAAASESPIEFEHAGERYLARTEFVQVRELRLLVHVLVPELDYTQSVDTQARRALGLGLLATVVAVAGGVCVARWIARPLHELVELARRIRGGDLDVTVTAKSRDEIGVLARAMAQMVQGLRDREFIREAFGRFVSPELAERCLRDRDALRLGGEAREVTVLMSDLRDFSALSERIGPEAVIALVNRYLGRMTPVIGAHGGTIMDFIGDGILVLFGAPFSRPDDTVRAARCAWAMQGAMDALNAESRRLGLPELGMGIAVHTGLVVAGNIGGPERIKYGAVGPPVNLASRIQGLAGAGVVLISAAALARTGATVHVGPPRSVRLKGAAAPVTVYPVIGVAGEAAGTPPAAATA
jgi:class 3 adenylate cyclase